ncbi:MAG: hypothetical protein HYW90_00825 [Candidatus Sungbacteria bacterium]|nr:hypothetical protein [Candidatus Sungbacteria bacterium]
MLNLNLLPPNEKRDFRYELYRRTVLFFGFWLSVYGVVFGILATPAYFFAVFQLAEFERSRDAEIAALKESDAGAIEDKINVFNQRLQFMIKREEKKQSVVALITGIFSETPKDVEVSLVKVDVRRGEAVLLGKAKTRGALLQFIAALRKDPIVGNVSSPVSNIIKEENIDFSLNLKTNP